MSLAKVDVDENVEIAMEYLVIKLGYVFIRVIPNKKKKCLFGIALADF